jgi:hypothetical protein
VYKWMVGTTLVGCYSTQTQNSCEFTRPDGSEYLAIWDCAQTCTKGSCTKVSTKVDPKYLDYLDLTGSKNPLENSTVPIGLQPIWLEAPGHYPSPSDSALNEDQHGTR